MHEWEGRIADELDLTQIDVAAIRKKHPSELKLQTYVVKVYCVYTKLTIPSISLAILLNFSGML